MRRNLCAILVVFALAGTGRAEVIGVGLDWQKGVFVQEYWQAGVPRYLVANLGKDPIKVTVSSRQGGAALAGPWEVPATSVRHFDAPKAAAGLLQFKLADGSSLGLLDAPTAPAAPTKDKIATNDGLNGSGGRHVDLWCEQEKPAFTSGGVIELTLLIPAGKGTITFKKAKGLDTPPEALIREARSDTLAVTANDKEIRIDTTKAMKDTKLHAVTLRFDAPKVMTPTLIVITGWCRTSPGGGFGVTRGVVVEPAKNP